MNFLEVDGRFVSVCGGKSYFSIQEIKDSFEWIGPGHALIKIRKYSRILAYKKEKKELF
jgi:hypothetical protein